MAVALSPGEIREHVLEADRGLPPERQTRWKYRILSAEEYYRIQDGLVAREAGGRRKREDREGSTLRVGTLERDILLAGLAGVENFTDPEGAAVSWPSGRTDRIGFLSRMLPAWRTELANAITGALELDEAERRN